MAVGSQCCVWEEEQNRLLYHTVQGQTQNPVGCPNLSQIFLEKGYVIFFYFQGMTLCFLAGTKPRTLNSL